MESSLKTAEVVRKNFPHLRIFARARKLMMALGHSKEQTRKMLTAFRDADEKVIQEQYKVRDNEKEFINQTKLANEQLAEVLRRDLSQK